MLPAQIIDSTEAERCDITPSKYYHNDNSTFSSSQHYISHFGWAWPQSITWRVNLNKPVTGARLAIRYSCDQTSITARKGTLPGKRELLLTVDRTLTGTVPVPETGGSDLWQSSYMQLPPLDAKIHTFSLSSPAPLTNTNLDLFTLFIGDPMKVLPPPLRSTIVAQQAYPHIVIKMTPHAYVGWTPEQLLADFTKIYNWFHDYMGWEPDRPVVTAHFYEVMNEVAHENTAGVHFEAANAIWDKGNWVHEMNHVFDNGYFPGWIGHPLIRTNDAFNTCDGIFPTLPKEMADYQVKIKAERAAVANKLLQDPAYKTDNPHDVLFAIRIKYGPEVLRKFYHALKAANDRGEIKLQRSWPERGIQPLNKEQIAKYMSEAAGEDVHPLFYRWTGWAKER